MVYDLEDVHQSKPDRCDWPSKWSLLRPRHQHGRPFRTAKLPDQPRRHDGSQQPSTVIQRRHSTSTSWSTAHRKLHLCWIRQPLVRTSFFVLLPFSGISWMTRRFSVQYNFTGWIVGWHKSTGQLVECFATEGGKSESSLHVSRQDHPSDLFSRRWPNRAWGGRLDVGWWNCE